ncbi:hypothetical protein [Curtobacterium luteum]|uniref:hypothetical protein n=1 Tax=Curtobacterium luteum TaxID=33881 RepID=UPI00382EAC82
MPAGTMTVNDLVAMLTSPPIARTRPNDATPAIPGGGPERRERAAFPIEDASRNPEVTITAATTTELMRPLTEVTSRLATTGPTASPAWNATESNA